MFPSAPDRDVVVTAAELRIRWARTLVPWGAPAREIDAAGADVMARYGEEHRAYHTAAHVAEVLAMAGDLVDLARQPEAVELAAWLHDVVYEPRAGAGVNEAASAALAAEVLGSLGVDDGVVATTGRLIELTADHTVEPGDVDGAVLVDADLWILAAPPGRYRRYAAAVRSEHAWVDDAAWRQGRSAVLRRFAGRPRLYVTDRAHAALDGRARRNLEWELAALGGTEAQP